MAKYDIPKLTAWALQSATCFWKYATEKFWRERKINIGTMPEIVMNPRLTSTAGRAFNCNTKIDLSCYLMERNPKHFHFDTIPHELCHIIASRHFGSKGHDAAWYGVVDYLGVKTSRLHNMTTKSQARKMGE